MKEDLENRNVDTETVMVHGMTQDREKLKRFMQHPCQLS